MTRIWKASETEAVLWGNALLCYWKFNGHDFTHSVNDDEV